MVIFQSCTTDPVLYFIKASLILTLRAFTPSRRIIPRCRLCASSAVLEQRLQTPIKHMSNLFQLKDLLTELQTRLDGSYTEAIRQNEELNLVSIAQPLARAPFKRNYPCCSQQRL